MSSTPASSRASRQMAAARHGEDRRSRRGPAAGSTSARAPPARAGDPAAGAAARGRAARRRARAGAGCASSCTSPADRSRSPDRSCAWTGARSGAPARARSPPAEQAARCARDAGAAARRGPPRARPAPGTERPACLARRARRSSGPLPAAWRSRRSRRPHRLPCSDLAVSAAQRPLPPARRQRRRPAHRRAGRCPRACAAR